MGSNGYRIVLRGRLSERFESAFEGVALEHGPNQTVLVGDVRDQAQLHGLLDRLCDFGIEPAAVQPAGTADTSAEPGSPRDSAGKGPPMRCVPLPASSARPLGTDSRTRAGQ
jgi:hypothetical protein